MAFDTIERAIQAIAEGRMVIVVDDDDRENEGDLIMAAGKAQPEQVAFMIRHTSGILCTPMLAATAQRLHLDPMVARNDAPMQTAFTVSVDHRSTTTGISAAERTDTIRALANDNAAAEDFVRPGHIFPLVARNGGVLVRSGHTEAAIDLAQLAGLQPLGLIAELVNDDGSVKRLPQLREFAAEHDLLLISIADLIDYRQRREQLIERRQERELRLADGHSAQVIVYGTPFDATEHVALIFGDLADGTAVPARIQREEVVGDVFHRDAGALDKAMARLRQTGQGVLIYLRHPQVGLSALSVGTPEDEAHATARARQEQWREVGLGAQILRDLGVRSIKLLATSQRTYVGLSGFGIDIESTEML